MEIPRWQLFMMTGIDRSDTPVVSSIYFHTRLVYISTTLKQLTGNLGVMYICVGGIILSYQIFKLV
jgi:hypothetical protein